MNEEVSKLVNYRLDRANESIREAALLLVKGYSSPKHSGVMSLFHQQLVKLGLVEVTMGHLYDRLYDSRQKSDYADLVTFETTDVRPWVGEAKAFVSRIMGLIH